VSRASGESDKGRRDRSMIILGVDPGSIRTGWGVIELSGGRLRGLAAGTVEAGSKDAFEVRLQRVHEGVCEVIDTYKPAEMAVEDVFFARNARSVIKLGQVRGVVLLAGAQAALPIGSYAPALVKRSVAGNGRATKQQIAQVACAMLGFRTVPGLDATDALAIAITHANASRLRA
jgi:crossover junction endodeoxyribonuclease RuvC